MRTVISPCHFKRVTCTNLIFAQWTSSLVAQHDSNRSSHCVLFIYSVLLLIISHKAWDMQVYNIGSLWMCASYILVLGNIYHALLVSQKAPILSDAPLNRCSFRSFTSSATWLPILLVSICWVTDWPPAHANNEEPLDDWSDVQALVLRAWMLLTVGLTSSIFYKSFQHSISGQCMMRWRHVCIVDWSRLHSSIMVNMLRYGEGDPVSIELYSITLKILSPVYYRRIASHACHGNAGLNLAYLAFPNCWRGWNILVHSIAI